MIYRSEFLTFIMLLKPVRKLTTEFAQMRQTTTDREIPAPKILARIKPATFFRVVNQLWVRPPAVTGQ